MGAANQQTARDCEVKRMQVRTLCDWYNPTKQRALRTMSCSLLAGQMHALQLLTRFVVHA